jgi:hypothetical protein
MIQLGLGLVVGIPVALASGRLLANQLLWGEKLQLAHFALGGRNSCGLRFAGWIDSGAPRSFDRAYAGSADRIVCE